MNCKNVRSARECIAKNETVTCLTTHFAKVINYGIGNLAKVINCLIGISFTKAMCTSKQKYSELWKEGFKK